MKFHLQYYGRLGPNVSAEFSMSRLNLGRLDPNVSAMRAIWSMPGSAIEMLAIQAQFPFGGDSV